MNNIDDDDEPSFTLVNNVNSTENFKPFFPQARNDIENYAENNFNFIFYSICFLYAGAILITLFARFKSPSLYDEKSINFSKFQISSVTIAMYILGGFYLFLAIQRFVGYQRTSVFAYSGIILFSSSIYAIHWGLVLYNYYRTNINPSLPKLLNVKSGSDLRPLVTSAL